MLSLLFGCLLAAIAQDKQPVDLMMVLAVDVSSSVTGDEYVLQKDGIVSALRSEDVGRVLEQCNSLGVALSYVEWSGIGLGSRVAAKQVLRWHLLRTSADLKAFAALLDKVELRSSDGDTDIAHGLRFSLRMMNESTFEAARRIISLSGDGPQNVTRGNEAAEQNLAEARQAVEEAGVSVEALVITNEKLYDLAIPLPQYFEESVIVGPGSRVEAIGSYEEYAQGLRETLLRALNSCTM